jgi:putative transposase
VRSRGIRTIDQKPRNTFPGALSERFPWLVDVSTVTAVDEMWATGITTIPLSKAFLYLVDIANLFTRNVLSWKLSNGLTTQFCLEALRRRC